MLAGWHSDDMLSRYAGSTAVVRAHDARPPQCHDGARYSIVHLSYRSVTGLVKNRR